MVEIVKNLFIGNQDDYELDVKSRQGWVIVHECREPYHRQALGYTSRGAPRDHPEYLFALRENRLILNIVDADDPRYIHDEVIRAALDFIYRGLISGKKVLVHYNQLKQQWLAKAGENYYFLFVFYSFIIFGC